MRELRADCSRCTGLCCVAPAFARSADFALDKPARRPCPHLQGDFRCDIHAGAPPPPLGGPSRGATPPHRQGGGFGGCRVYACWGGGRRPPREPSRAPAGRGPPPILDAFETVRALHELLWYITAALDLP